MAYTNNARNTRNTRSTGAQHQPAPAQQESFLPRWTDIGGAEMTVFRNESKDGSRVWYNTSIGRKDKESGEWDNLFVTVRFPRDKQPDHDTRNGVEIEVLSGFLTFDRFTDRAGVERERLAVVVTEYNEL